MAFNQQRIESFAMQAEVQPDSSKRAGWADIDEIGTLLGLSQEESRECAQYLKDSGWAATEYASGAWIRVTLNGRREIAKLRQPKWRRWVDAHPILVNVFWMIATAILASLATHFIIKVVDRPATPPANVAGP